MTKCSQCDCKPHWTKGDKELRKAFKDLYLKVRQYIKDEREPEQEKEWYSKDDIDDFLLSAGRRMDVLNEKIEKLITLSEIRNQGQGKQEPEQKKDCVCTPKMPCAYHAGEQEKEYYTRPGKAMVEAIAAYYPDKFTKP